jgi:hypothetical protein
MQINVYAVHTHKMNSKCDSTEKYWGRVYDKGKLSNIRCVVHFSRYHDLATSA